MSWQLGLSRFIHGLPTFVEPAGHTPSRCGRIPVEREARLLPALIATLFDFDGSFGAWPPTRVAELLTAAGGAPVLRGGRGRETLLLEGLAALDAALMRECGVHFEALSPVLRRHVLNAFECGELGLTRDAAARFMDALVHAATFAFLQFELDLAPLPGERAAQPRHA